VQAKLTILAASCLACLPQQVDGKLVAGGFTSLTLGDHAHVLFAQLNANLISRRSHSVENRSEDMAHRLAVQALDEVSQDDPEAAKAVSLIQTNLVVQGSTAMELGTLAQLQWEVSQWHADIGRGAMIVAAGVALVWALHHLNRRNQSADALKASDGQTRLAGMTVRQWVVSVLGNCAFVAMMSRFQWAYGSQDTATPLFSIIVSTLWIGPAIAHWFFGRLQPAAWIVRCEQKASAYVDFISRMPAVPEDPCSTTLAIEPEGTEVLGASLEHVLPHKGVRASAGGLGTVLAILVRRHPTPITLVHPMMKGKDYKLDEDTREPDVKLLVDGVLETVKVYKSVSQAEPTPGYFVTVTYLLLDHELFMRRPEIYPNCMTDSDALSFFSLWNQVVGALLIRYKVHVFHCPDYHTALAPLYAHKVRPNLRVLLILHNAAYHGNIATDMVSGQRLAHMSRVFNLPKEELHEFCLHEGRFNMLRAASEIIRRQDGTGACAVSEAYAKEVQQDYSFFRSVQVSGLDNPMEEDARLKIKAAVEEAGGLRQCKRNSKLETQRAFGLNEDAEVKMVVFLGRMVKQKGTDLIADIASWMLDTYQDTQLVFVGPVGDAHGIYTKHKAEALAAEARYKGRLYACCKFIAVPPALYLGADFCFMPSRDEPFGYVDIEFAWRGALSIGSAVGGLGKVPGFYYRIDDRENDNHLREGLMQATTMALETPAAEIEELALRAMGMTFPLATWQSLLHWHTSYQLCASIAGSAEAQAKFKPASSMRSKAASSMVGEPVKLAMEIPRAEEESDDSDVEEEKIADDGDDEPVDAPEVVFQPEMTMDELSATVENVLQERPDTTLKDILVEAGTANDLAYETSAISRALLLPVFGTRARWVHIIISIGYITSPVAEMAVVLLVQQWITRAVPMHSLEAKKLVAELRAATFVVHSLGSAVGSAFWYMVSRVLPPRTVLMIALLLEPPLLMGIYVSSLSDWSLFEEGRSLLLGSMFFHGASSASAVLFVVFNFMMTLAELRESAMIVGVLDTVKLLVTLALTGYVFSVMTIDVRIGQAPTIYIFAVVPLLIIVVVRSLSACPLVFAPRGYRDEVLPDLGLMHLGLLQAFNKYKAYAAVTLMDCVNQIAAFPGLLIVVWWTLSGWTAQDFGWAVISAVVIMTPFFVVIAIAVWRSSSSEIGLILEAALYIPPTTPLLTLVIQEASNNRKSHNLETWAFGLSIAAFILKYMRNSALGMARFRLLRSQWHFAAFRTIEACAQYICRAASPQVCALVLQYSLYSQRYLGASAPRNLHMWSFDAAHQRELANAITITALPFAVIEMMIQHVASQWVREDLSAAEPPLGHPKVCPEVPWLKAARLHAPAWFAAGLFLISAWATQVKMVAPVIPT